MMEHIILVMLITMTASALQGVAGFGGGLISMGLLSLFWPVAMATAVLSPLGVVLNSLLLWRLRAYLRVGTVSPILLGLPFGVTLGVIGLEHLPDSVMRAALGVALLVAVSNMIWGKPLGDLPRSLGWFSGVLSGVTGASLSAPGPPILVYATLSGWDRDQFRAQLSLIFLCAGSLATIGLSLRGLITIDSLLLSASLIPGIGLASEIGLRLGTRLPQHRFRVLVLILLSALASRFFWGATRGLLHL